MSGVASPSHAAATNKWWALAVLTAIYISSFVDRMIVGVLGEPIKREFGLADWQVGLLNGLAFSLTYTVLAIPIARLSEKRSRISIITVAASVWSVMTFTCGLATTFPQLLLARAGVGIGEAGATAPSHAVIADYFPSSQRGLAISIYSTGVPVGVLVGGVLGGWAAQHWGWRNALWLVAAIGVVFAVLLRLTVREPVRGMSEKTSATSGGESHTLVSILQQTIRMPIVVNTAIAMTLAIMANASVKAFAVPLLIRKFDVSIGAAGQAYGLYVGVASIAGTVLGGVLSDRLAKRNPAWMSWVPAASVLIGGPITVMSFHQSSFAMTVALLAGGSLLLSGYIGASLAAVYNSIEPSMRATTAALIFLLQSLVGYGLGPPLIGYVSDVATRRYASGHPAACHDAANAKLALCSQAAADGLATALTSNLALYVASALLFYLAGNALKRRAAA